MKVFYKFADVRERFSRNSFLGGVRGSSRYNIVTAGGAESQRRRLFLPRIKTFSVS